jgi:hypothetical protein
MAMFKPSILLVDQIEPPRSNAMRLRYVFLLAVIVIFVPLAVEAVAICCSQWCEVMGRTSEVRTPMIDSIEQGLQDARESLAESVGPTWHTAIRDPSIALPVSSVLIVVAMAMLRR